MINCPSKKTLKINVNFGMRFALLRIGEKEAHFMRRILFATILLAGMIYCSSVAASLINDEPFVTAESNSALATTGNVNMEYIPGETVEVAAVDYCYAGSIVDATTGETVDVFVLCTEDGVEHNIDVA